jgi:hypothetical protein
MNKAKYWSTKDVEIKKLIEEREIEYDLSKYSRTSAIEALMVDDVKTGESKEMLVDGDDGLEEVDPHVDHTKVRFHNTRDNEAPYIFLGHNGKAYYVPKEVDIYVPNFLLDSVVKDAVEIHSESVRTPLGKMQLVEKKVQRFPYTEVRE